MRRSASVSWRQVEDHQLLWVWITIGAAFMQNLRSALQRRHTATLGVLGASYSRFLFAWPFAAIYLALLFCARNPLQLNLEVTWSPIFFLYVVAGGVAQILATSALVGSFAGGHFGIGTALSKTEAMQAAVFGMLVLGEQISSWAMTGILVSLGGVICMTWPDRGRLSGGAPGREVILKGVVSGALFAVSAVCYRGAALSLEADGFLWPASLTLGATLTVQTLLMGTYLFVRSPDELFAVVRSWRSAGWIGVTGLAASLGWFTAMTLERVALVRAVAQVELIFTFATAVLIMHERVRIRDVCGALLVVCGILLLLA